MSHIYPILLLSILTACSSPPRNKPPRFPELAPLDSQSLDSQSLEASTAPITSFDQVEIAALRASPDVREAYEHWQAALERIPQARALPNTELSWGNYLSAIETRAGPLRNVFGINQAIPWPGKLITAMNVAEARAEAARWRFISRQRKLREDLINQAYDLKLLQIEKDFRQKLLQLAQQEEGARRARYRSEGAGQDEYTRILIELGRLEDTLASLNERERALKASINALLDLPGDSPILWSIELPELPKLPAESQLRESLLEQNADIIAQSYEVQAEDASIDRARQELWPDLRLGLDYFDTASAIRSGTPDSSDDAILLKFGISVPLWFERIGAMKREAIARTTAAQARQRSLARQSEAQLTRRITELNDAQRRINFYTGALIPRAEASARAMATRYEASRGDYGALLAAQRSILELELERDRARAVAAKSLSALENLIGRSLSAEELSK